MNLQVVYKFCLLLIFTLYFGYAQNNKVGILVIDDYVLIDPSDPNALSIGARIESEDNCLFHPEGTPFRAQGTQKYVVTGGGSSFIPVPHGDTVFQRLRGLIVKEHGSGNLISKTNYSHESEANIVRDVEYWNINGSELYLVAVDTDGFRTGKLPNIIDAAMAVLDLREYVLNMSFVIVPCNSIDQKEYEAFFSAYEPIQIQKFTVAASTFASISNPVDVFYEYLVNLPSSRTVIEIAAAGNDGDVFN